MTINEIAKMAGVSRATISRYLNDGYVSEEKREVIQRVIEQTGYEPSMHAQNLRKQVTKLVGVIIPKLQSESMSREVDGITDVLSRKGYSLLLANTHNDEKEELKYLHTFKKSQVDGLILIGTILTKAHMKCMKELEVPVVVLGQEANGFSCVYHDDYRAAKEMAGILLETARKPGFIGVTTRDKAVGSHRKQGFLDACREAGIVTEPNSMKEGTFTIDSGYEKARELLTDCPDIDAIFCVTDNIAIGALKYLHEKNITVPKQVSLVGFGNNSIGQAVIPALTTVHFYYRTSGREAARLLLELLETGEDMAKSIKIGYRIEENRSTRSR